MLDKGKVAVAAEQRFQEMQVANYRWTDRMFAKLMVAQFILGVTLSVVVSPYTWSGAERSVHAHVWLAIGLGGLVSLPPVVLAVVRPGHVLTRHVVAISQMLWSAILIHLTGGRIETHFHVFGSLAFLAFYRDWRILIPATAVVVGDHLARQLFWPQSVYGLASPEWWRVLEHGGWVLFENIVLVMGCVVATRQMREVALRRAEAEAAQAALARSEKLAAVGQLAASVSHELRNPLAAIRNASVYVSKRITTGHSDDPKVPQFLGVMERELAVCSRIISDLLDFARERQPELAPCPLRALADEAIALVPKNDAVQIVNALTDELPVPSLDKLQFRQVLMNLVQNAVEAIPPDRQGLVTVTGVQRGNDLRISITDNGPGIPADKLEEIFEPLFTTKTKGTGLGLAIVRNAIKRHGSDIHVESKPGVGTSFHIDIAANAPQAKAA